MAQQISVSVSSFVLDGENPRLSVPNQSPNETLRILAKDQGRKLLTLAKDIVDHGLNPADLPIVTALNDDLKRYVVLEGNRRIVALKSLENPDVLVGSVDLTVLNGLREISRLYHKNPIDAVQCIEVADREEANHWIELRHSGENDGAGTVRWSAAESARFRERMGSSEPHIALLNLLEQRGELTPAERSKLPVSTLQRLVNTPEVRERIGVQIQNGELELTRSEASVAAVTKHIVADLLSKRIGVRGLNSKQQRVDYAGSIPASVGKESKKSKLVKKPAKASASSSGTRNSSPRLPADRNTLIPRTCVLKVTNIRLQKIETELKSLSISEFPNAVSVLLRVFIELSCDAHATTNSVQLNGETITPDSKLKEKLQGCVEELIRRQKLTRQQAQPVRTAMQKDSFFAVSLDSAHAYVHSNSMVPIPADLRAFWDGFQPFMMAIWSP